MSISGSVPLRVVPSVIIGCLKNLKKNYHTNYIVLSYMIIFFLINMNYVYNITIWFYCAGKAKNVKGLCQYKPPYKNQAGYKFSGFKSI